MTGLCFITNYFEKNRRSICDKEAPNVRFLFQRRVSVE